MGGGVHHVSQGHTVLLWELPQLTAVPLAQLDHTQTVTGLLIAALVAMASTVQLLKPRLVLVA